MSVNKSVASRNNREIIVHEYHPYVRNATYLQTLHGNNMSVGGMKSRGGNLSCNCTDEGLIWGGCGCVPEWWLICYYTVIGAAFFCNVFVCGMLLKRKKDGILASILQLALVDTATASIAIVEVLDTNHRTWKLPSEICPLFLGTETLVNSLSLYLIVFFNFHVISTYNLHFYQLQNGNNNPLTSCVDGDSEEFLVSTSRNSLTNRNVALDYSKRKHYVSILLPSVFVWLLCVSLSVPEYSLAQTLRVSDKRTVCTVMVETHYKQILRYLLILFKILVPVLLMLISFFILLIKLYTYNCGKSITKRFLIKKTYTVNFLVSFAIGLSSLYIATSFQRLVVQFINGKQQVFSVHTLDLLKISKLENFFSSHLLNVLLSMFHYSATALRSVLYICMLPELRENFIAAVLSRSNKSN